MIRKILLSLVSLVMFIITPIISLYALVLKLIAKKDFYDFDGSKKRNVVMKHIVSKWWGISDTAQKNRTFALFVMPTLFAFSLFVIFTFLHGIYLSMTNWTGLNTGHETFIAFENYSGIFQDYGFAFSLYRTALYSIISIFVINIVAFFLAMMVTQNLKLRNLYRAGFFLPNLIGGLVLGYIWQFIFNRAVPSLGGIFSTSLLINGNSALIGLVIVVTWQYAGYIMMIYIAALQNVPQDLIEASKIDGANAWQRLKTVTMPLVAQAFTVSMFLTLVTSFKQFDTISSLTQGGPAMLMPSWLGKLFGLGAFQPAVQGNELIAINIYNEAFTNYSLGVGQAKAVIFFSFLVVISLLQVYYNKRKEVEL